MNLRIKTKNHKADPEIGYLTKSIQKPFGRRKAMPPAWELIQSVVVLRAFGFIITSLYSIFLGIFYHIFQVKSFFRIVILNFGDL